MLICTLISVFRLASALEREALGLGNRTGKGDCRWGLMGRGYRRSRRGGRGQGPGQAVVETLEASFCRVSHVKPGIGLWPLGPMGTEACACRCPVMAERAARKTNKCRTGTNTWATLWDIRLAVPTVLHLNHGHLWGQG